MENNNLWDFGIAIMVAFFGLVNALITLYFTPILDSKKDRKNFEREKLYQATGDLASYLSTISYSNNSSVDLSAYRKLCLNIHILFDEGTAPDLTSVYMEDIFQLLYYISHNNIAFDDYIREVIRNLVRKIRSELSQYIKNGTDYHSSKRECEKYAFAYRWTSKGNILVADLNSHKYIYKCEHNSNSITVLYNSKDTNIQAVQRMVDECVNAQPVWNN